MVKASMPATVTPPGGVATGDTGAVVVSGARFGFGVTSGTVTAPVVAGRSRPGGTSSGLFCTLSWYLASMPSLDRVQAQPLWESRATARAPTSSGRRESGDAVIDDLLDGS